MALACLTLGIGSTVAGGAQAAPDPTGQAGIWTLKSESTKNQCRLVLRTDPFERGYGLSLPPACRRAAPSLLNVKAWTLTDDGLLSFQDASGNPIAGFVVQDGGALEGKDNTGQNLTLTRVTRDGLGNVGEGDGPIVVLKSPADAAQAVAKAPPAMAAATPAARSASRNPQDIAGNYAVLRGDRDTGCMIVLDGAAKGPDGTLKARLAPACRDGSITVFDPLGWQLQGSGMVLMARKGHTIRLDQNETGAWVKMPVDAKALVLKRL